PVDDDLPGNAGRLIDLFCDRDAADKVLVAGITLEFGDNRRGERIPLRQLVALAALRSFIDEEMRDVAASVAGRLSFVGADKNQFGRATDVTRASTGVNNHIAVRDTHRAIMRGFDREGSRDLRRTADIEATRRKLLSRRSDGLRGENTDSLAGIARSA